MFVISASGELSPLVGISGPFTSASAISASRELPPCSSFSSDPTASLVVTFSQGQLSPVIGVSSPLLVGLSGSSNSSDTSIIFVLNNLDSNSCGGKECKGAKPGHLVDDCHYV